MKTVVSVNEISEFEIKPRAELAQWKNAVAEEIKTRWAGKKDWVKVDCPVCASSASNPAFDKSGFVYVECSNCKTLYAKERPSENELNWWYKESASTEFWTNKLLKLSAASRDEKIIEPRTNWIMDGLSEYLPGQSFSAIQYTDISFFGKALIEKVAGYAKGMKIVSAGLTDGDVDFENNVQKAGSRSLDDFSSLDKTNVLVAIDVLERISGISKFLGQVEDVVLPNGLLFATCPVSSGFEIQSLWEHSPSVIPPDKLNLPSVQGLIDLFTASGKWKILELSTPGMFDVEMVKQTIAQLPNEQWPRSLRALVDTISPQGVAMFTEYLQSQRLSSFARIVLRRI